MSHNYVGISNSPSTRSRNINPFCFWSNAFNEDELSRISEIMKKIPLDESLIIGAKLDTDIRRSQVAFHYPNEENQWIFERLNTIIENLNFQFYNFDINGYDRLQYGEYKEQDQGTYDWHVDCGYGIKEDPEDRKLSLTLMLNDDYDGGDFEIIYGKFNEPIKIPKEKGKVIVFPSFLFHRVTPVTRGIRKSIVVWVIGPKFR
jgi:PKHD-type hydroxylase